MDLPENAGCSDRILFCCDVASFSSDLAVSARPSALAIQLSCVCQVQTWELSADWVRVGAMPLSWL
ncbi:Uncharacterised protein [Mycobacterium tuberculosis]|nr:Uncharacterised protein [Mycobacterium tuberculosis]